MKTQNFLFSLIAILFFCFNLSSTNYYVATNEPNASDNNNGTSLSTPFKTIQKAASVAIAGDIVNVREGTYREQVVPANSGSAGKEIIYQTYNNEKVVISGADIISGWSPHSGNIYKAAMPSTFLDRSHNQDDQIFVNGKMMFCARWPNQKVLDPTYPDKSSFTAFVSKTRSGNVTTGVFDDTNLTAGDYVGADIYVQPNFEAWSWLLTGKVKSVSGTRVTFESNSDNGQDGNGEVYAVGSRYYIYNKLSLLDAAGEWFHDNTANLLYLWCPANANPNNTLIEAKKREFAFKLDGLSFITIKGFELFASTITSDAEIGGDCRAYDNTGNTVYPWRSGGDGSYDYTNGNITIDGISATYLSHFTNTNGFQSQQFQGTGLYIAGNDNIVRNCNIKYSAGNGIVIAGRRGQVANNIITDVGYQCAEGSAISTGVTCVAYDHRISFNTIKRCGRWGIGMRNLQNSDNKNLITRINNNDVSEYMLQDWDGGATYTASQDARFVRVDHNYFHDALGPLIAGFYVDYSKNWVADHNIIWNVTRPCHLQGMYNATTENNVLFYNNTCAAKGSKANDYAFGVSGYSNTQRGTVMQNNIFYLIEPPTVNNFSLYTLPGEMSRVTNLEYDRIAGGSTDPKFTNVANADFTLNNGSNAINKGTAVPTYIRNGITVPAYTDAVIETVDIGALEFGTPMFPTGASNGVVIAATGVVLNKETASVIKGLTLQLAYDIVPGNATNNKVTWTTSDPSVASVSNNGLITGLKLGTVKIRVFSVDGHKMDECILTVRNLNDGEYLTAINCGGNAYADNNGVEYTEDKFYSGGFAAYNGDNFYGASDLEVYHRTRVGTSFNYEIPVPESRFYQVTLKFVAVSYNGDITGQKVMDVYSETQKTISALDVYKSAGNKNTYDVTIDNVFVYDGKLSLSFLSKNVNNIDLCAIIITTAVVPPPIVDVTSISLNKTTIAIVEGVSEQLIATLAPANANNKGVIWASSDESVASVSNLGIVTAYNIGNAIITATTANSGLTASCNITVTAGISNATIASTTASVTVDGIKEAVWAGTPYNIANPVANGITGATDCSATWTALWDIINFYVFVDVKDDVKTIDSGSTWWDDDRVEIYIDGGFERGLGYDTNDFQYYFAPGDNVAHEAKRNGTTGVVVSSVKNATGYRVEVKIPWTTIGVTPLTNMNMGFDVMIGDDDNGGGLDGKLAWYAATDNTWQSPKLMGQVKLTGVPVPDIQAPTAPSGLSSSNVTSNSFILNWMAATDNVGVKSYEIFQNGVSKGASKTTTFSLGGLNTSTNYTMTVVAKDAAGNVSNVSNALIVTTLDPDTQAPTVPEELSVSSVTTNSFILLWNASSDDVGVSSYEIFQNGVSVGTSSNASYDAINLTASTTYKMAVRAKDEAGNVSNTSIVLNVTTEDPDILPPSAPSNVLSSNITISGFSLSWAASQDNKGVSSYEIFINGIYTGTTKTTVYTVSGVSSSTTFSVTVKAKDLSGNVSEASLALNVTTDTPDTEAPTVPEGLVASNITSKSFILSWTASSDNKGVKAYEIFLDGILNGTSVLTSYKAVGLNNFTTYALTVKAKDEVGNASMASEALHITTLDSTKSDIVSDLSMHLKFDETGGTMAADASGKNNTGTLTNGSNFANGGKLNNCVNFDGIDDHISVKSSTSISPVTAISVNLWFRAPASTGNSSLIMKRRYNAAYELGSSPSAVEFKIEGLGVVSTNAPSVNVWHMLTGTYDGEVMKIFVDNSLKASTPVTGILPTNNDDLVIGSSIYGNFFKGQLDEVRIYNRCLTGVDVTALYDANNITNSLEENMDFGFKSIYPNPATSYFTVVTDDKKSVITVISTDGRIISSLKAETEQTTFNVSNWNRGVYLIHLQTESENVVRKIILK